MSTEQFKATARLLKCTMTKTQNHPHNNTDHLVCLVWQSRVDNSLKNESKFEQGWPGCLLYAPLHSNFIISFVSCGNEQFFPQIENCFIQTFPPQFVLLQVVLMDHFCRIAVSDHFSCRFCTTSQSAPNDYLVTQKWPQLTLSMFRLYRYPDCSVLTLLGISDYQSIRAASRALFCLCV